jgi:hypothetical protein
MRQRLLISTWNMPTRSRRARHGMSSLEVVMTAGVLLPLAGLLFFLGIDMCKYLYGLISTLVGWPYT